jgi:hypothetical protein
MYLCLWLIYTHHDGLKQMQDRDMAGMHKYGESKTTRIMMATVRHVTLGVGHRELQVAGFC